MKIRLKLLILLLAIALVPLIVAGVSDHYATRHLGDQLARRTRAVLENNARRHLQRMVDDYGRIIHSVTASLEQALRIQALEVERRLARPVPPVRRLFFTKDYDEGVRLPAGMKPSTMHFHAGPTGRLDPVQVTYDEQVYVVAPGTDAAQIRDDMLRLSTMPGVYKRLRQVSQDLIYWQYTSMESGFHSNYPGHGGYADWYDPRRRTFYQYTRDSNDDPVVWLPPMPEASTQTVVLGLAMRVHRPDGSFAGVTAIDIDPAGTFKQFKLPGHWQAAATGMLIIPGIKDHETEGKIVILAETGRVDRRKHGERKQIEQWRYLEAEDQEGLAALMNDAMAGRSGVRKMAHRGRAALWAYGAGMGEDRPFPIVIVPYDHVVAEAAGVESDVRRRTLTGLMVTGIILVVAIAAVVVVAVVSSRSVTRPVRRLAEAAEKLASGDYGAHVELHTGDELQELGDVVNDIGPKLQEHEKIKRALALAMEIQQHLLPQGPPTLDGFDIAGQSVYSDETGGDYFDFINVVPIGPSKLGIAVGDVTGHGIGAALLMASARGVLRSHAGNHVADLDKLFDTLNTHLVRDTGDERFMTLFYAVLDAEDRSLRWVSGGHDPALWVRRSSGSIEELPTTGIPLGVLEQADFPQAGPVTLESGDLIVIGTDGIWEAHNEAGEMFGKQRLRDMLAANADRPAADIHAAVVQAVHGFRKPGPQEDDITLVVIKAL